MLLTLFSNAIILFDGALKRREGQRCAIVHYYFLRLRQPSLSRRRGQLVPEYTCDLRATTPVRFLF